MNYWIQNNFEELKNICKGISKGNNSDELLQISIEQFLLNKRVKDIPERELLYFFIRIAKNNFYSKSSPYYYQFAKFKYEELPKEEIPEQQYQESPIDLDWVMNIINEGKKTENWYYYRLFELFIQVGGSITELSKKTHIPMNSVSRDINKVRKILKEKRNKIL